MGENSAKKEKTKEKAYKENSENEKKQQSESLDTSCSIKPKVSTLIPSSFFRQAKGVRKDSSPGLTKDEIIISDSDEDGSHSQSQSSKIDPLQDSLDVVKDKM